MTNPFGGLLNKLYPTSGYEDLVDPAMLQQEQNLALRRSGLALLAGAGPRPRGTRNFGADLAQAFDPNDWQNRLGQAAQRSATIGEMQRKAAKMAALDRIMARFPAPQGETDIQRDKRLAALADALQTEGFMEEAKSAADLRTSLRSPEFKIHGNYMIDPHTGQIVGILPTELQTPEGSMIYSQADARLKPYEAISAAIDQYNLYRNAPITMPVSQGLQQAAQNLLDTSKSLAEAGGHEGAIGHLPVIGEVAKMLSSIFGNPTKPLTEPQRQQLLAAIDPLIDQVIAPRHARDIADIRRIFAEKWGADNVDRMFAYLRASPSFNAHGRVMQQTPKAREMYDAVH